MPKKKKQLIEENPMFRFINKYRVFAKYDLETYDFIRSEDGSIDPTFDDYYLLGTGTSKDEVHHSHDNVFVLFVWSLARGNRILENLPKEVIIDYEKTDGEVLIYFDGNDIDEIHKFSKFVTKGSDILPTDVCNLPGTYDIPEKMMEKLKNTAKERGIKPSSYKGLYSSFLKSKSTKNNDLLHLVDISGISTREFIYKKGFWNDFIKYIK